MLNHFEFLHDAEALVVQVEPLIILLDIIIAESKVIECSGYLEV